MDALSALLRPRSVAVIGASADPAKTAGRPIAYLQKHGFDGAIYPVNPRAETIAGLPCYASIDDLPGVPDVGIVLLGAERAIDAVRALAARGTHAAIVLASGYAETDAEGQRRQQALLDAAGGMRLLGPNTIGTVNLTDRITLSASAALEIDQLPAGGIGVISQSGGILGALLSRAAAAGIGLSKLISTSNEADLDLADFVAHLADDPATRVIALYVESIRNPDTFRAAARKAARAGKPIVAFKIGRSEAGARAAVSHTGAMAGADRMYDALFAQLGVIRAQTFADLLDLPAALASPRRPAGTRVAVLTSTGGAGTLVADSLGMAGFETPVPDAGTAAQLRALQQGDHAALDRNPIDVTLAGLQPELLRKAIRILLDSPAYDALVVIVGSSSLAMPELMANAIRDSLGDTRKPVLAYVSPHAPGVVDVLNQRGVPAFTAPERVSAALQALYQAGTPAAADSAAAPAVPALPADLPAGTLDEAEAKGLFAHYGVAVAREVVVRNTAEAEAAAGALGDRVVLKILSRTITHKSDVGGVAVGLTRATIGPALEAMRTRVAQASGERPDTFIVQEMVAGGSEWILGLRRDPLGTAVLLGMGGVTAELFNDTALRMLEPGRPLSPAQAASMIRELKSWPLLDGYRGRPRADVDALAQAIVAFSAMAASLGERLVEAEVNPLFVLEQGVRAADGVVVLAAG